MGAKEFEYGTRNARFSPCTEHQRKADEEEEVLHGGVLESDGEALAHHLLAVEQTMVEEFVDEP